MYLMLSFSRIAAKVTYIAQAYMCDIIKGALISPQDSAGERTHTVVDRSDFTEKLKSLSRFIMTMRKLNCSNDKKAKKKVL